MRESMNKYNFLWLPLIFVAVPLVLWGLGSFPQRSVLKESLSVVTLLGMFLMFGQFFWVRGSKMIFKTHKYIGYTFAAILLLHPLFVVIPRYFEAGVEPLDAFWTIITSFNSLGVILGLVAWFAMVVLGLMSMFRKQLNMKYKLWRSLHGILSVCLVIFGTWHAVELGRHASLSFSVAMTLCAITASLIWINTYFFNMLHRLGDAS